MNKSISGFTFDQIQDLYDQMQESLHPDPEGSLTGDDLIVHQIKNAPDLQKRLFYHQTTNVLIGKAFISRSLRKILLIQYQYLRMRDENGGAIGYALHRQSTSIIDSRDDIPKFKFIVDGDRNVIRTEGVNK
jgi:hypothetical protein